MSRDDEMDYRVMHPVEFRNRKRRSANPRPAKQPAPRTGGFFPDEPKAKPNKDHRAKELKRPLLKRIEGRYVNEDGYPVPSMKRLTQVMLAKNLNLTVDDLIERLQAKGYEPAPLTISTFRQEIISVLSLCERYGSIIVPAWND
jgi:hypothetical protein